MTTPKPSFSVRGSTSGRPIMALLDLLGRRMSLRVLWELREGPLTFRALQEAAATNPSVLNVRLKELREARLVEHGAEGYGLTGSGRSLLATFGPLSAWAEAWARLLTHASSRPTRRDLNATSSTPRASARSRPATPKAKGAKRPTKRAVR